MKNVPGKPRSGENPACAVASSRLAPLSRCCCASQWQFRWIRRSGPAASCDAGLPGRACSGRRSLALWRSGWFHHSPQWISSETFATDGLLSGSERMPHIFRHNDVANGNRADQPAPWQTNRRFSNPTGNWWSLADVAPGHAAPIEAIQDGGECTTGRTRADSIVNSLMGFT